MPEGQVNYALTAVTPPCLAVRVRVRVRDGSHSPLSSGPAGSRAVMLSLARHDAYPLGAPTPSHYKLTLNTNSRGSSCKCLDKSSL